jgi:hypothetical protein
MNDSFHPRRVLHLLVEGVAEARLAELKPDATTEVFRLDESTAREALEKIFAADTVAVWTKVD